MSKKNIMTKTVDDICNMLGCTSQRAKEILEKGVEIGVLKKINENEYEMTGNGFSFASTLSNKSSDITSGNWMCTKCKTVNNALNGMSCIKCSYSFHENLYSQILESEKKELKYPKVTERETLLFVLGQLTGVSLAIPVPQNISFAQKFEQNKTLAIVMTDIMHKIKEKFPDISEEEFDECLIQLNAIRTGPILDDALKDIMRIMKS